MAPLLHRAALHPHSSSCPLRRLPCAPARAAAPAAAQDAAPAPARVRVGMVQRGCPKNTVDAEVVLGHLAAADFEVSERPEDAEVLIVNTCSFIDEAKAESLEAILDAAQLKADSGSSVRRVVVTGCMAQRYGADLAESIPEADLVVGFQRYGELPASIREALAAPDGEAAQRPKRQRVLVGDATVPFRPEAARHRLTPAHTAYLRVAEGCNHACTFCAIPSWRGRFRSKPWAAAVAEAAALVASGVQELCLIAEDTNQYGQDVRGGPGLAELLRELGRIEGLRWMRLLYCYPSYFTDELIDEIATNPKVCKYIDIPLQHICNLTLLAMNRPPREHTERLLRTLRARIPGLALRITFISGFPDRCASRLLPRGGRAWNPPLQRWKGDPAATPSTSAMPRSTLAAAACRAAAAASTPGSGSAPASPAPDARRASSAALADP